MGMIVCGPGSSADGLAGGVNGRPMKGGENRCHAPTVEVERIEETFPDSDQTQPATQAQPAEFHEIVVVESGAG